MAQTGEDLYFVLFEFLPRPATVSQAALCQGATQIGGSEFQTRRYPFDNSQQCFTVRFTGSNPFQHASTFPRLRRDWQIKVEARLGL